MQAGQRLDGVESVEEEVGVHLALQRLALSDGELLLLLACQVEQADDLGDHDVEGLFEQGELVDGALDTVDLQVSPFNLAHAAGQRGDGAGDGAAEEEG